MPADPISIPGCSRVEVPRSDDARGSFVKPYQRSTAAAGGFDLTVAEFYYSRSSVGVIRGLHFQRPPHDHAKLVFCLGGSAFDVVLDLRAGSPTFSQHVSFSLDADAPSAVHVPTGCAHGFQALAQDTVVGYLVSSEHEPSHDSGIRWDSAGIAWPLPDALVSARDRSFPELREFATPFRYQGAGV